jgi:hypothetical protein
MSMPSDDVRERERDMAKFRDAAKNLGVDKLRDGSWFRRVIAQHTKKHFETVTPAHWDAMYPRLDVEDRAHEQIVRVARKASAAGVLASIGASTGELLSLVTEGLAAPVGVPAAAASMLGEAAYTSLLQIDLACDLASMYGVPFDADDVGEVATLFGLALEVDIKEKKKEEADAREDETGLTAKLMALEDGEIAARIGKKLIEEAVMRNIIPIVNLAISARWNYVATKKLGGTVKKYVRYRRALKHSCGKLRLDSVTDPAMLVEGAWLLATVDGEAGHEEVLAMALIMDQLPEEKRKAIELDKTLGDDEEEWFDALVKLPHEMHDPLLDTLYMIAATDKELEASERRFLRRVGKALKRDIELDRITTICEHLNCGEELPDDFLHCSRRAS